MGKMPTNMEELGQMAYATFPKNWRGQNLVTAIKENLDPEELERHRELTRTKTPSELAQISSISEFPVPDKIKNLFERKENGTDKESKKRRHSDCDPESSEPFSIYSTIPRSLRETKLITNVKVEADDEILKARQTLVETKSPAELSAICSIADLPIPSTITRLVNRTPSTTAPKQQIDGNGNSNAASKMNLSFSGGIPEAFTMQLAVSAITEDQDIVAQRRKLIEEKSPMELGNIGSLADLPIPAPIMRLVERSKDDSSAPEKPKRKTLEEKRKRNPTTGAFLSGDFLPESWRETKLIVRSKVEDADDEDLKNRQLLVETKKPNELSQIHGLSDLPVPTRIQTLMRNKKRVLRSTEEKEMSKKVSKSALSLPTLASFTTIPESLKAELLVKSKVEDPERAAKNREIIKTKSVSELSQIQGLSDFPIPDGIENFFKQNPIKTNKTDLDRVETDSTRPTSPTSFKESIYESLPRSLIEQQLVVKTKIQDVEKAKENQELTRTKSPTELSQIHSFSDLPIPKPVENLLKKKSEPDPDSPIAPPRKWRKEDIYESLPTSLTMELAVGSKVSEMDADEVQAARAEVVKSKSVSELSQITSLSDIPVPDTLIRGYRNLAPTERKNKFKEKMKSQSTQSLHQSLYGSLPRSLKQDLLVKQRLEDPEILAVRREIVASKSVSELSQITSFSDIPVPTTLRKAFHKSLEKLSGFMTPKHDDETSSQVSRSRSLYDTLPRSLTDKQLLVRTKVEADPDLLAERQALVEAKSPVELSQINSLADFPIPSRVQSWLSHTSSDNVDGSPLTMPRNAQEMHDAVYGLLPASLTHPLMVRKKVEDPDILLESQQLQQSKSIHELSKIRNLNEFPVPGDFVKLPDVPLPKFKNLLQKIAPTRSTPKSPPSYHSYETAPETLESTPVTSDDKVYLSDTTLESPELSNPVSEQTTTAYEELSSKRLTQDEDVTTPLSSPTPTPVEESIPDEVLMTPSPPPPPPPVVEEEEEEEFSLAEQVRGTPERSMRKGKGKSKNRRSHDVEQELEVPPPLPPKKLVPVEVTPELDEEWEAVPVKGILTLEADMEGNIQVVRNEIQPGSVEPREISDKADDAIQSRPLPPPPAPPRSLKKKSSSVESAASPSPASPMMASCMETETGGFKTCRDTSRTLIGPDSSEDVTLADSVVDSLVSCADTLVGDTDVMETCADTLTGENDNTEFFSDDDNPYPSVDFDAMMRQGPGAGAKIVEDSRPGRSTEKKREGGRRLEEGTAQLSMELMEYVESLKTTLDNMSSRLGTRSRSRSNTRASTSVLKEL